MRAVTVPPKKSSSTEDKKRVLRTALIRVAKELDLSRQELSAIVGLSEASFSRIFSNPTYYVDPTSKEGELALLLIRLYRSLDILFGGNQEQCRMWMQSDNTHLGMAPLQLVQAIPGLIHAVEYLDAMRGKN